MPALNPAIMPMTKAASQRQHTLSGLLLPLTGSNLLLPNAAVVEVSGYPETIEPVAGAPDWYLGRYDWRGLSLPLVEWERLMGRPVAADPAIRKNVAICHLFSAGHAGSFVGLETSGLPRLVAVSEAGLKAKADSTAPDSCILGKVRVQDTKAYIPDLEALGGMIASLG